VATPSSSSLAQSSNSGNNSFTDPRDNKTYKTVKIGTQVWMAQNLNNSAVGSMCYNNSESNCGNYYGRLYDWETAKTVCPAGWHLPVNEEWDILSNYVDGGVFQTGAKHLKAKSGWDSNGNGLDTYGFAALPIGLIDLEFTGEFKNFGSFGYWWSARESINNSSKAHVLFMRYDNDGVLWTELSKYGNMLSVRCLQN
jgi:uncharacterized protein (TIGR02145 family)